MRMRRVIVAGSSGIQAATRGPASLVPRYFGPLRPQSPLRGKHDGGFRPPPLAPSNSSDYGASRARECATVVPQSRPLPQRS